MSFKPKDSDTFLTEDESNALYYTYTSFLTLFHSVSKVRGVHEAGELLTKKVRKLLASSALCVLLHLETHQGYTIPELVKSLGLSWQTADRVHKSLLDVGLVKQVVKVDRRFMSGIHRPVPVFLLHGAPPEAAHEAMKRYGEYYRKDGLTQATVDEAIAAIKLVRPDLQGNLRDILPLINVNGITYQVLAAAVHHINNREGGKIWV